MNNFKSSILVMTLALSSTSAMANNDWFELDKTERCTFEGQSGSLEFATTRGGERIAVVNVRTSCKDRPNQLELARRYVTLSDCERQRGKLVALDMSGNFKFENDFVFGGGTVATTIASVICEGARLRIKDQQNKSI